MMALTRRCYVCAESKLSSVWLGIPRSGIDLDEVHGWTWVCRDCMPSVKAAAAAANVPLRYAFPENEGG